MKLSDFDYYLPTELIAQKPLEPRDKSRLFVLPKNQKSCHKTFSDIIEYLEEGDVLVLNNSKVFPARLFGKKKTGGKVEILLNHEIEPGLWEAIGKGLKAGSMIFFDNSRLTATVEERKGEFAKVRFSQSGEYFFKEIEVIGNIPLPPYIHRSDTLEDKNDYQTVFAKERGSAAAPTAGLHFTPELLDQIRARGVVIKELTLHVGLGTFLPVKTENILEHQMHEEFFSVQSDVVKSINDAKSMKKRIFAVGTTTTRVLEYIFKLSDDAVLENKTYVGSTDIFIYPGFEFKCIDGLITNFHLPKSTLLMLVSAFAGKENILSAYKEAVDKKYRFFSYGDAMLIMK